MDNMLFFWEFVALACKRKEDLAILLLDFQNSTIEFVGISFMVLL